MKILSPNQYVDLSEQKDVWYQLAVINKWDFDSTPVCSNLVKTSISSEIIHYKLMRCTPIDSKRYKFEPITELTPEMQAALIADGYAISIQKS